MDAQMNLNLEQMVDMVGNNNYHEILGDNSESFYNLDTRFHEIKKQVLQIDSSTENYMENMVGLLSSLENYKSLNLDRRERKIGNDKKILKETRKNMWLLDEEELDLDDLSHIEAQRFKQSRKSLEVKRLKISSEIKRNEKILDSYNSLISTLKNEIVNSDQGYLVNLEFQPSNKVKGMIKTLYDSENIRLVENRIVKLDANIYDLDLNQDKKSIASLYILKNEVNLASKKMNKKHLEDLTWLSSRIDEKICEAANGDENIFNFLKSDKRITKFENSKPGKNYTFNKSDTYSRISQYPLFSPVNSFS